MRAAAAVIIAFLAGCAQPSATPPAARLAPPVAALLAQMRAACGGAAWDRVRGWHETGRVELPGGAVLPYEAWHSMRAPPTAVYANRVDGRIVRLSGYDGRVRWQAGPDGRVTFETDPAALRRIRRDAYLSSFGWLLPARFPATFVLLGVRRHEGRRYDVLEVTPEGGDPAELWIDRETRRVARLVTGAEHAELSGYRFFSGVCTPTLGRQGDGDPAHDVDLHVERVETGPVDPARFAPPPAP
jgi:hypothetical protein